MNIQFIFKPNYGAFLENLEVCVSFRSMVNLENMVQEEGESGLLREGFIENIILLPHDSNNACF